METTKSIRIDNPSTALVAFIKKAQDQKKVRMEQMRQDFIKEQRP